jgi:hypothetical protein
VITIIMQLRRMIVMLVNAESTAMLTKITQWSVMEDPPVAQHDCAVNEAA